MCLLTAALLVSATMCRAQHDRTYLSTSDSTADRLGTFPHRVGDVNDFEKLLTNAETSSLASILHKHQQLTGQEIVVVTTKSYVPYPDMGHYAQDLGIVWGIGKRKQNDGLIIMLSKAKGEIQIVPNDGLKTMLTDKICNDILDRSVMGHLEHEEYGKALIDGSRALIKILEK